MSINPCPEEDNLQANQANKVIISLCNSCFADCFNYLEFICYSDLHLIISGMRHLVGIESELDNHEYIYIYPKRPRNAYIGRKGESNQN